jgi:hypothetical protein
MSSFGITQQGSFWKSYTKNIMTLLGLVSSQHGTRSTHSNTFAASS